MNFIAQRRAYDILKAFMIRQVILALIQKKVLRACFTIHVLTFFNGWLLNGRLFIAGDMDNIKAERLSGFSQCNHPFTASASQIFGRQEEDGILYQVFLHGCIFLLNT